MAENWTEDLTITLGTGSIAELVEFILDAGLAHTDRQQTYRDIQTRFQISVDDADLAMDRTYGGLARARTGNAANQPDPTSDPIAFASYQRATSDATLLKRLGN